MRSPSIALGKLREAIQSKEIRFENNNPLPAPAQEAVLDQLAMELKELAALSSTLRVTTRVTLTGHSDTTGHGLYNLALSLARAEARKLVAVQRTVRRPTDEVFCLACVRNVALPTAYFCYHAPKETRSGNALILDWSGNALIPHGNAIVLHG